MQKLKKFDSIYLQFGSYLVKVKFLHLCNKLLCNFDDFNLDKWIPEKNMKIRIILSLIIVLYNLQSFFMYDEELLRIFTSTILR